MLVRHSKLQMVRGSVRLSPQPKRIFKPRLITGSFKQKHGKYLRSSRIIKSWRYHLIEIQSCPGQSVSAWVVSYSVPQERESSLNMLNSFPNLQKSQLQMMFIWGHLYKELLNIKKQCLYFGWERNSFSLQKGFLTAIYLNALNWIVLLKVQHVFF